MATLRVVVKSIGKIPWLLRIESGRHVLSSRVRGRSGWAFYLRDGVCREGWVGSSSRRGVTASPTDSRRRRYVPVHPLKDGRSKMHRPAVKTTFTKIGPKWPAFNTQVRSCHAHVHRSRVYTTGLGSPRQRRNQDF